MYRAILVSILAVALLAPVSARADNIPRVPCAVFGEGANCVSPLHQGVVDGQWVGLIYVFSGSNGGVNRIAVVTVGFGGNGLKTFALPTIEPDGGYDGMYAEFHHGKLYVFNTVYLPGEAHCCPTHVAVRRFGFHNKKLAMETLATVDINANLQQIDAALGHGPRMFP